MKKEGDTITVNKPGHLLHGVTTEIVSINPESARPVKINHYGEWFLTCDEIGIIKADKPLDRANNAATPFKSKDSGKQPKAKKVAVKPLKTPEKPKGKAGRPAKPKTEPDKPKRKYTKKAKA